MLDLETITDELGLVLLRDFVIVLDLLQEGGTAGEDDGRQQPHATELFRNSYALEPKPIFSGEAGGAGSTGGFDKS